MPNGILYLVTPLDAALLTPMLLPSWMDPEFLIHLFGPYALWGVAFVIFAECGLFAILPGDSLLFTAGLFTSMGIIHHSLLFVCAVLTIAAVLGNICGYWIGRLIGPPLFKPRTGVMGKIFKQSYVDKTHVFFEKYGNRALILARFVPIVRTFATVMAGASRMDVRRYAVYSVIGGVAWAGGLTLVGHWLSRVAVVRDHVELFVLGIVALSLVPVVVEVVRSRRAQRTRA
jgi:membrane-associated protein